MADLSVLMPIIMMVGMMFIILLGLAVLFKSFYKKVPSGEVMIVSTMATEPLIVRNGALVYPIIYSSANVSLNVVPVEIDADLTDLFLNLFDLNIFSLSVQVIDTEETILKAHKRISLIDAKERNNQLFSVVNVAVREQIKNIKNIQELNNSVNETLSKIGYELVA